MSRSLAWVGYVVGVIALGQGIILTLMPSVFHSVWNYILPIVLVLTPAVSLILASRWALIAGAQLMVAGLYLGTLTITLNVWVAAFYALPVLVAGLAFLLSGILSSIEERAFLKATGDFGTGTGLLNEPSLTEAARQKVTEHPAPVLEFGEQAADDEEAKWVNELGRWKPAVAVINGDERTLTSQYLKKNTQAGVDTWYRIELILEWDEEGGEMAGQVTRRLAGKPLAIFEGDEPLRGEHGRPIAPIIQGVAADRWRITGLNFRQAFQLSKRLNLASGKR